MKDSLFVIFRREVNRLFNLREDKAFDRDIDKTLRAGAEIHGTNLWVLIFAIFMASLGLNVNSTAVIIGAMLISPLMGPIMGIGYGVGIYDFSLIRKSFRHLTIAVVISLVTSTIYFSLSPLTHAQSELLARTTPTIWDVLIAFVGGLAGIIGVTRQEKTNIIPGVAIATALMPPLCTAGYGLATSNWAYFGGALYLFMINSVFIALSSIIIIRFLKVEQHRFVDEKIAKKIKNYAYLIAFLTITPSIYLAYILVHEEIFKANASLFIKKHISSDHIYVAKENFDAKNKIIEVTVIGDFISDQEINSLNYKLAQEKLAGGKLLIYQHININEKLNTSENAADYVLHKNNQATYIAAIQELTVLFPTIKHAWLADAVEWTESEGLLKKSSLIFYIQVKQPLSVQEKDNLQKWLSVRLDVESVKIFYEHIKK